MSKIICSICARGGSKGVPNKNMRMINGYPLIYFTIKQAIDSKIFDKIVISTDDDKIIKYCQKFPIDHSIKRIKSLSNSKANKVDVIRDLLLKSEKFFKSKFDIIIDLDVTSPLRDIKDIKSALSKFIAKRSSVLLSCCNSRKNPYYNIVEMKNNRIKVVKNNSKKIIRRQDAPLTFDLNASIYIWRRNTLLKSNNLFHHDSSLYVMDQKKSMDIDTYEDFDYVKWKISQKKNI